MCAFEAVFFAAMSVLSQLRCSINNLEGFDRLDCNVFTLAPLIYSRLCLR